jgi:hypothetical protein
LLSPKFGILINFLYFYFPEILVVTPCHPRDLEWDRKVSCIFSRSHVNRQPIADRSRSCETTCIWVGHLSSHGTGVYDGPQEVPRYFIIGGEYLGHNLLCVNWVGMRCAEKVVIGLDQ